MHDWARVENDLRREIGFQKRLNDGWGSGWWDSISASHAATPIGVHNLGVIDEGGYGLGVVDHLEMCELREGCRSKAQHYQRRQVLSK